MKFKGFVCLIAVSLLIFSGCATQSSQTRKINKTPFHKPKNWDTPINITRNQPTPPSAKSFNPSFSSSKRVVKKQKSTNFRPKFNSNNSKNQTNFQPDFKSKKSKTSSKNVHSREQMDGYASWYGPGFHGKLTANGERYNQNAVTAAHRILPMNTKVRVTNMENGKYIIVRINDRGPYKKNRVLDLTKKGANLLGFHDQGTARVRLDVIKFPASYDPSKGLKPYKQAVIQLAVFKSQNRAGDFKAQLSRRYNSIPFMVDHHKNGSYHVVAGPYDSRNRATKIAKSLKSDGVNSFVRSYKK